jgi:hypothetical protein
VLSELSALGYEESQGWSGGGVVGVNYFLADPKVGSKKGKEKKIKRQMGKGRKEGREGRREGRRKEGK